MPKFDLIDHNGRIIGQVDAPTHGAARTSPTARSQPGFYEALPHREDWSAPRDVPRPTSTAADSEARLVEAFGRMGMSAGEAAQAARGRRRPWEQVEPLAEARRLTGVASRGPRAAVETPEEKALAQRRWTAHRDGSASRYERLDLAARLVAAGHSPATAAYIAGAPPADKPGLPAPADVLKAAAPPASTSESVRPDASGEVVQLREQQIGSALGRAFRLSESEASIAGRGR